MRSTTRDKLCHKPRIPGIQLQRQCCKVVKFSFPRLGGAPYQSDIGPILLNPYKLHANPPGLLMLMNRSLSCKPQKYGERELGCAILTLLFLVLISGSKDVPALWQRCVSCPISS